MKLTIWLALGSMLGWGIGDFLIQKTSQKIGELETLFYLTFVSSFLFLPFVTPHLSSLTTHQLLLLSLIGVLSFISGYLFLKALKIGKLAVIEVVIALELPLTIAWGCLFFHEALSLLQILLIILIFAGVILISCDFSKIHKRDILEPGTILAIITALVLSLVNFLYVVGTKEMDAATTLWLAWLVNGLICGTIIYSKKSKNFIKNSQSHWQLILAVMLIDAVAWLFYLLSAAQGQLSITSAISESFMVIAIILGLIFNREKINIWQSVGAGLAIIASFLIALVK
jgi:drug/metabolite transporter (DMT)-like permease